MQVSACPYPDYGTLKGTVRTVAPDAPAIGKQRGREHPPHTEVIIQPQTRFVGNEDRQCRLQPVWRVELILFRARRHQVHSQKGKVPTDL